MTTTAHEDQFTTAPEPVRQPYDTDSILRRNIASLEVALKQQTERAEAAEAELAKLAQQSPIKYLYRVIDCFGHDVLRDDPKGATILETIPLYAAPVPAPHKGATHCDDCGLTWLDDGLNPLGCPYCKESVPAPAVPNEIGLGEGEFVIWPVKIGGAHGLAFVKTNDPQAVGAFHAEPEDGQIELGADDLIIHFGNAESAMVLAERLQYVIALLQSAEVHPDDKWQLTPAPTHPADRDAREVRHD